MGEVRGEPPQLMKKKMSRRGFLTHAAAGAAGAALATKPPSIAPVAEAAISRVFENPHITEARRVTSGAREALEANPIIQDLRNEESSSAPEPAPPNAVSATPSAEDSLATEKSIPPAPTALEAFITSPDFEAAKKAFQERTEFYVEVLNSGVDAVERTHGGEVGEHITVDVLYGQNFLGYGEVQWYMNSPDYIQSSISNYDEFPQWVTGRTKRKPSTQKFEPVLDIDIGLPGQAFLAAFAQDVTENVVQKDRSRIRRRILGNRNLTRPLHGEVEWEAKPYSEFKLPLDIGGVRALVHEDVHATVPHVRKNYDWTRPQMGQKFAVGLESGDLPTIQAFDTMWAQVFLNNIDFFKRRFFDVPGDATLQWIRDEGGWGLKRAIGEFQAMLCADLALPDETQTVMPDEYPPQVMDAVLKTWNFVRNGTDAIVRDGDKVAFLPAKKEEITGEGFPEGQKSVRGELHRAFNDYSGIFAAEISKTL